MLCMAVTGKPMSPTNTGIPRQLQQNSLMSSTLVTSALICELRWRKKQLLTNTQVGLWWEGEQEKNDVMSDKPCLGL